jgi:hypothetical protein
MTPPTILRCRWNAFPESLPRKNRETHRPTRPTILLLLRVFVAAGTCLPSRRLAVKEGIHIQTHTLTEGIYEVRR